MLCFIVLSSVHYSALKCRTWRRQVLSATPDGPTHVPAAGNARQDWAACNWMLAGDHNGMLSLIASRCKPKHESQVSGAGCAGIFLRRTFSRVHDRSNEGDSSALSRFSLLNVFKLETTGMQLVRLVKRSKWDCFECLQLAVSDGRQH